MFSSDLFSSRADAIMGILWAFAVVATVMMILRAKVWLSGNGQATWALLWAAAAYVVGLASQALLTISFRDGMGGHIVDVEAHGDLYGAIKWGWISSSLNLFGIAFGKWSIIAFLLTIHGPTHFRSRMFLLTLAVLNMALDASLCFVIMFQCNPPEAIWDFSPEVQAHARCSSAAIQRNLGFTTASVNSMTDFVLAAYPIMLFRHSQTMPIRKKIFICVLMSAGVIGGASGIAKAYQIQNIESSHDQTWDTALLWVWTWSELWVILIAACVPPLAPFFRELFGCFYPRESRAFLRTASVDAGATQRDRHTWFGYPSARQFEMGQVRRETFHGNDASDTSSTEHQRSSIDTVSGECRPSSRQWYGLRDDFHDAASEAEKGAHGYTRGPTMKHPPQDGIAMTKDVTVGLEPMNEDDLEDGQTRCSAW